MFRVGVNTKTKLLSLKNVVYLCDPCLDRARNECKSETEEQQDKSVQTGKECTEEQSVLTEDTNEKSVQVNRTENEVEIVEERDVQVSQPRPRPPVHS
ncbi:hypothetical protein Pcinc_011502 [Petrolisthes cinctipes]|uniref:Uncharacterized protein n=1 Tax=Petrolisthes cinctipes TaxID=88211 RepID=A0AAE1KSG7_PETCI|nr:hypothetical protein Pcinc_011502 [Petrolisthes cinctipes]